MTTVVEVVADTTGGRRIGGEATLKVSIVVEVDAEAMSRWGGTDGW